jgi:hypothetical protein
MVRRKYEPYFNGQKNFKIDINTKKVKNNAKYYI